MSITLGDILAQKVGAVPTQEKYWLGNVGDCDICTSDFGKTMYDARVAGTWGNVCEACFEEYNGTLGTGHGQKYRLQPDGRWLKVGG